MSSQASNAFTHVQRVRLLFKTILRLHRGLPVEMKALGDQYVKDEFKRHKTCKPEEANVFMIGWVDYAVTLAKQLNVNQLTKSPFKPEVGRNLTPEDLNAFRDEQIGQLYELMQEAHNPKFIPEEAAPK